MTKPLALIEGDLALPDARLLRSLPPPFGLRRQPARSAQQRDAQPLTAAAEQQAIRTAARHKTPVRQKPLPPGTIFRFFYKVRPPRDHSCHIDAQLAEARYYLDVGKTRVRSSRRDYVLGASIFAITGIALAWLLTSAAMRDADKSATTLIARPAVVHSEKRALQIDQSTRIAPAVARNTVSAAKRAPVAARAVEPKPSRQAGSSRSAKAQAFDVVIRRATASASTNTRPPSAHLSNTQIDDRPTPNRSTALSPSAQASTSTQPEWAARAPFSDATPEQTALLNWAAQQPRTAAFAASTTTNRAGASSTPADVKWNARMAQRRITDNPGAFSANTSQP